MNTEHSNYRYNKAKKKVERLKGFYNHLVIYLFVNTIITGFKVYDTLGSWERFTDELFSFNVLTNWILWGVFLVLHYISIKFGYAWEERKLQQYMEEELNND